MFQRLISPTFQPFVGGPKPAFQHTFQLRERVHCFLYIFVLLQAQTAHQLKEQTLACLNLIFKVVDKEYGANEMDLALRPNSK